MGQQKVRDEQENGTAPMSSYKTVYSDYEEGNNERQAMLTNERELKLAKSEPENHGWCGCCNCCGIAAMVCRILGYVCSCTCMLVVLYLIALVIIYFGVSNDFQLWALQQPSNPIVQMLLPPVEFAESLACGQTQKLAAMQHQHGYNYAHAGMIWMGSASDIEDAVLSPQKRTFQLGEHPLIDQHMPGVSEGRNVFLLALSDAGAGGGTAHEAFRNCFTKWILGDAMKQRFEDPVAKGLIDQLVADYKNMPHAVSTDEFWTSGDGGLTLFTINFLHYVCFGIAPDDDSVLSFLKEWYVGQTPLTYYLRPLGSLYGSYGDLINKVADIYENSPALANFQVEDQYDRMTKRELALLCTTIFRLAGVQGFKQMASIVLGAWKLGGQAMYPQSPEVGQFDQLTVLDQLDLFDTTDDNEILSYILECTRLDSPVSVVHRVLETEYTGEFGSNAYTFPAGTKVAVPLAMGNVDEALWNDGSASAYAFDMHRPNLHDKYMSFNSIGTQSGGRECPGRLLVQQLLIKLVKAIGTARRPEIVAQQ